MTTTGANLLTGLSRYLGELDFPAGLVTTSVGDSTTLVDTSLSRFDDDYLVGWYIRITENVNSNQYLSRRITNFVGSTGTCTVSPAFAGATGSGTEYELHRYNPEEKFSALDEARISAYPALGQREVDDTSTGDGVNRLFDIPTAIRRGPVQVYTESFQTPDVSWNFLTTPQGNSTTGWTASSLTLSTLTKDDSDLVVPKREATCQSFAVAGSTNGTLAQAVAAMSNGVTAAAAAGRKMTAAFYVYCLTASRVSVKITDDAGTTTGTTHQGRGWELIYAERTISPTNATLLTATLDVSSSTAAVFGFAEHRWFYYGGIERVRECYSPVPMADIRRDNATQQILLTFTPDRGQQIRMVGRQPLSALGTTVATQPAATMEIDEFEAELLYTEAAKVLFTRGVISSGAIEGLSAQIQVNEARLREMKQKWEQPLPHSRIKTMWA